MIDIESKVLTAVKTAVTTAMPKVFVSGEYLRTDAKLPAVSIIEMSNIVPSGAHDSSHMEAYARIMYQVDVYSADAAKKKSECRKIAGIVDNAFAKLGFRRIFMQPVPNVNNATIYRITCRYQANVTYYGKVGQ